MSTIESCIGHPRSEPFLGFCRSSQCSASPAVPLGGTCTQDNQCGLAETPNDQPSYCAPGGTCGGGGALCYADDGSGNGATSICSSREYKLGRGLTTVEADSKTCPYADRQMQRVPMRLCNSCGRRSALCRQLRVPGGCHLSVWILHWGPCRFVLQGGGWISHGIDFSMFEWYVSQNQEQV